VTYVKVEHDIDFGDLVEHHIFGQGKVLEVQGSQILVEFEDSETKRLRADFVSRVRSGEGKGVQYWYRQWCQLTGEWQAIQEQLQELLPVMFRPVGGEGMAPRKAFVELLQQSNEISSKIEEFIGDEDKGLHK
jgi:hypothetical protein